LDHFVRQLVPARLALIAHVTITAWQEYSEFILIAQATITAWLEYPEFIVVEL